MSEDIGKQKVNWWNHKGGHNESILVGEQNKLKYRPDNVYIIWVIQPFNGYTKLEEEEYR